MITLIKSWLEIDQSIKCWYQSSAESEINVPSLFLRTVNHSINQSINQTIDQLIDWSIMITNLQSTNTRIFSVEFMKEKTFNSLRVSLWHPQRSWGDILLFYVSFFSFYFYSSTHFVHAISRNWSDPCWWNYTIIWTAMWSCARDIGMVKNGRRYHGN